MKKEQLKTSFLSISGFLLFMGILVAVNFIGTFVFMRFDLTRNRIYSLSSFSKELVRSLEDPVVIKVYFSPGLQPPYSAYRQYLHQLLNEYKVYSRGMLKVDFVHYADQKKFQSEAQRQGIPPLRFDQVKQDKYEVQIAFMGLTINYIDSRETIPVIKSINGLEYDITSRIRRLISTEKTKIGFLAGHDEVDVLANNDDLAQDIQRDYDIFRADLQGATTFPHDMACLIAIGGESALSETDLFAIDQYLMQGKPLALFPSQHKADLEAFRVSRQKTGIEKLIEHYGVRIQKGMVIDPQCQRIAISQRQGIFSIQNIVDFVYVPRVITMIGDNPMIKDLSSLSVPFVSPLEIDLKEQPDVEASELLRSSKYSWINDRVYTINPFEKQVPPTPGQRKEHLLGVVLKGSWKSYYEKNKQPDQIDTDDLILKSGETRIIVVGSGGVFDSAMPLEPANFTFFVNMLDWLTQDVGIVAIRSKGVNYQVIGETSALFRGIFKVLNVFLVSIVMAGFGLFRWRRRKNWKERIALKFKAGEYVR